MLSAKMPSYERVLSMEDEFVAVKDSPFTDDKDTTSLPAVAVDWNSKQAAFNVTLISVSHEGAEERLWSDSFSISKIKRRHSELCLVCPELKNLIPHLPRDPLGIWGFIQWINVPPELCKKLEEYFKNAFNTCGWKLFSSVFFGEPAFFEEDYTISTLELKRNQYVKVVEQLLQGFQKHLVEKGEKTTPDELLEWYEVLWDCLSKVNDAERKLLAFDCEPFEELRDIAQKERSEYASTFNQQSMTTSTFQNNVQNFSQWDAQHVDSVKNIHDFRIAHFKKTLPRLQQILKLLQDDCGKFTDDHDKRTIVATKLHQFEREALQNEIEILNSTNQLTLLERDKIRRDVIALDEDLSMPEKLNDKEIQVYTKQCEVLGVRFDIQDKNEKIVRLDLQNLKGEVESEGLGRLNENLTQSLTTIARKKAELRNKKKKVEAEIMKLTRKEEEKVEQYTTHHAVQMKLEKRREENEERKDARLEERQKTLLRLKEYKKKYPKPKYLKPPRYQSPSERKQEKKVKTNSCVDTTSSTLPTSPEEGTTKSTQSPKHNGSLIRTNTPPETKITFPPPRNSCIPPPPPSDTGTPPPPPGTVGPPPPPPPPLPPPPPAIPSLPAAIKNQRSQSSDSNKSPLGQPSSLSQQTLDLDALKVARSRLKKQDDTTRAVNNNYKGFPSGNDLTRAIQSVKLRRVVSQDKPDELSPDGAQFLKKALERMNKFTKLSDDEDDDDTEEQEW